LDIYINREAVSKKTRQPLFVYFFSVFRSITYYIEKRLQIMNGLRKFFPLYFTNLFGVMNDNVLKSLVCFVAATWVTEEYRALIVNCIAACMVIPYVLFSPLAGRIPHFFSKQRIVRVAKICEIPIMIVAILGFYLQNLPLAMSGVLLMGFQSALFSPAKYGLIRDIGGTEGISMGMGGMEAFSFLGMLTGTFVGSLLADDPRLFIISLVLMGLALSGAGSSYAIRTQEQEYNEESSANPIKFIRDTSRIVSRNKGMQHVVMYLSLFWWLSASLQIILIIHCPEALGLSPSETGYLLAIMAVGVTAGCLLGGRINQRVFLLGYTPLLGIIISVLMVLAYALPFRTMGTSGIIVFGALMALIAVCGGLFKIPLDAEIQRKSRPSELNIVLAYFNLVSFIFILAASLTNILITNYLPSDYVFLFDGVVMLVWSLVFFCNYKSALCFGVSRAIRLHYDIELRNTSLMSTGPDSNVLVMPMHRALLDPIMLFSELYDYRLQPMVDSRFFANGAVAHVLGLFDAVQVPDLGSGGRAGVEQVQQLDGIVHSQLQDKANIIFYPSGHITMDGRETIGNRRMAYNACRNLPEHTRVLGVEIHGLWGSKWSNYGCRKTPPLAKLLGKSLVFILLMKFLFVRKRKVSVEFTDITSQVREWSSLSRQQFNARLEEFYNRKEDVLVPSWC